jgi:hypothetical protein
MYRVDGIDKGSSTLNSVLTGLLISLILLLWYVFS